MKNKRFPNVPSNQTEKPPKFPQAATAPDETVLTKWLILKSFITILFRFQAFSVQNNVPGTAACNGSEVTMPLVFKPTAVDAKSWLTFSFCITLITTTS